LSLLRWFHSVISPSRAAEGNDADRLGGAARTNTKKFNGGKEAAAPSCCMEVEKKRREPAVVLDNLEGHLLYFDEYPPYIGAPAEKRTVLVVNQIGNNLLVFPISKVEIESDNHPLKQSRVLISMNKQEGDYIHCNFRLKFDPSFICFTPATVDIKRGKLISSDVFVQLTFFRALSANSDEAACCVTEGCRGTLHATRVPVEGGVSDTLLT
jgi:hypothetical protein